MGYRHTNDQFGGFIDKMDEVRNEVQGWDRTPKTILTCHYPPFIQVDYGKVLKRAMTQGMFKFWPTEMDAARYIAV